DITAFAGHRMAKHNQARTAVWKEHLAGYAGGSSRKRPGKSVQRAAGNAAARRVEALQARDQFALGIFNPHKCVGWEVTSRSRAIRPVDLSEVVRERPKVRFPLRVDRSIAGAGEKHVLGVDGVGSSGSYLGDEADLPAFGHPGQP